MKLTNIDQHIDRRRFGALLTIEGWGAYAEAARQSGQIRQWIQRVATGRFDECEEDKIRKLVAGVGPHILHNDPRDPDQAWDAIPWSDKDGLRKEVYDKQKRADLIIEFTQGTDMAIQGPDASEMSFRQAQARANNWSNRDIEKALGILLDDGEADLDARTQIDVTTQHWIFSPDFLLHQVLYHNKHNQPALLYYIEDALNHGFGSGDYEDDDEREHRVNPKRRLIPGLIPWSEWAEVNKRIHRLVKEISSLDLWDNIRVIAAVPKPLSLAKYPGTGNPIPAIVVLRPTRDVDLITKHPWIITRTLKTLLTCTKYCPYIKKNLMYENLDQALRILTNPDKPEQYTDAALEHLDSAKEKEPQLRPQEIEDKWASLALQRSEWR